MEPVSIDYAVTVATAVDDGGCLTVAAITRVYTVRYIAELLGEEEDRLWDIANGMDPEDGHLWVYGVGDDGIAAFTDFGIENLKQILADLRADGKALPSKTKPT